MSYNSIGASFNINRQSSHIISSAGAKHNANNHSTQHTVNASRTLSFSVLLIPKRKKSWLYRTVLHRFVLCFMLYQPQAIKNQLITLIIINGIVRYSVFIQ
jgi:hypothetical protein